MPYSKAHKTASKDRILESASVLFCRYGFDKVSIGQIMKLARMTHGAFYAHFDSKEALFSASVLESFKRSKVAKLAKGPFSIRHLTELVGNYLNLQAYKNQPGPEAILINEIDSERTEIRKLYEETYDRLRKLLEVRIAALAKLRQLPASEDSESIANKARAILAAMVGAVAIARSIATEDERRNILLAAQNQIFSLLGVSEEALESPFELPGSDWLGQI